MNNTLKTMLVAAAALTAVSAQAQDKATLDLLVKKGVITAEERAKTLQSAAATKTESGMDRVFTKEAGANRLTFSGRIQGQWEAAAYSQTAAGVETQGTDLNNVMMRRLYLGAKADVGAGFSGELVWNFGDNSQGISGVRAGAADKAVVTSESTLGKFDFGYQKVQFGQEENTSSSALYTVERSMVTRYWAESHNGRRLGFGARHVGLHYSNKVVIGEGGPGTLAFGASIVDAVQGYNSTGVNDYGYYGNVSFDWKPLGTTIGINYGLAPQGGTLTRTGGSLDMVEGFNPYFKYVTGDLTVLAEYITTSVDASGSLGITEVGVGRKPSGYNITLAYKLSENLEAVARYSALDTDGRGQRVGDGFRDVDTAVAPIATPTTYDKSNSIFVGLNYYFNKNNAKIQLGYEKAKLEGRIGSWSSSVAQITAADHADADIFRLQAQVLF
ncbi:MAG: OprO/OprP family phosphate-selective porin [Opitutales bacterium]|nr:OprO/OprP family phosphate-selective porin [Opitutales bacterium]